MCRARASTRAGRSRPGAAIGEFTIEASKRRMRSIHSMGLPVPRWVCRSTVPVRGSTSRYRPGAVLVDPQFL